MTPETIEWLALVVILSEMAILLIMDRQKASDQVERMLLKLRWEPKL